MFTFLLNKCQETLSCACEQAGWAKFAADTFKGKQRLAEGDILYALFMIFTEGKVCWPLLCFLRFPSHLCADFPNLQPFVFEAHPSCSKGNEEFTYWFLSLLFHCPQTPTFSTTNKIHRQAKERKKLMLLLGFTVHAPLCIRRRNVGHFLRHFFSVYECRIRWQNQTAQRVQNDSVVLQRNHCRDRRRAHDHRRRAADIASLLPADFHARGQTNTLKKHIIGKEGESTRNQIQKNAQLSPSFSLQARMQIFGNFLHFYDKKSLFRLKKK